MTPRELSEDITDLTESAKTRFGEGAAIAAALFARCLFATVAVREVDLSCRGEPNDRNRDAMHLLLVAFFDLTDYAAKLTNENDSAEFSKLINVIYRRVIDGMASIISAKDRGIDDDA